MGMCAVNEFYCSGFSGCDVNRPYKCANGDCVENQSDCPRALRTYLPEQI